ncbi:MAG: hypothetical protein HGA45_07560 [Chloroflexales bacterium]|nr:hypothetical protein [Chloroflexales bacterium]
MPMTTIAFGIALIFQGIAGYVASGKASKTALIPTIPGGILALLGALAHRPNARAGAMHTAMLVAALGIAGAFMGRRRGAAPNPRAKAARALMASTCATYVALSARSYLTGRCAEARSSIEQAPMV